MAKDPWAVVEVTQPEVEAPEEKDPWRVIGTERVEPTGIGAEAAKIGQAIKENLAVENLKTGLGTLPGIAETFSAGLVDIAGGALQSWEAMARATHGKFRAGKSFAQTYVDELGEIQNEQGLINFAKESAAPQTEAGKAIYEGVAKMFGTALDWLGDKWGEHGVLVPTPIGPVRLPGTPETAALTKGATATAMLFSMMPGKPKPGPVKPTPKALPKGDFSVRDTAGFMAEHFPETFDRMMAAQTGRINPSTQLGPVQGMMAESTRQLEALGVPKTQYQDMGLQQRFRLLLDKYDPKGTIPTTVKEKLAEAYNRQAYELEQMAQAKEVKALPFQPTGPIEVTPSGKAATPEQRAAGRDMFLRAEEYVKASGITDPARAEQIGMQFRAETIGVGPMGQVRTRLDALRAAEQKAAETGRPIEARQARTAARQLEQSWNRAFPRADKEARAATLEQFKESGWQPYDEWWSKVYGPGKKQRGMLDIEGLDELGYATLEFFSKIPGPTYINPLTGFQTARPEGQAPRPHMLTREAITQAVHDPSIRVAERQLVLETLGDRKVVDARAFAKELGQQLVPLEGTPTTVWSTYGMARIGMTSKLNAGIMPFETGKPGAWTDLVASGPQAGSAFTRMWEAPFLTDANNHFSNANYFAHSRAVDFFNGPTKTRAIVELQSDLMQHLKGRKATPQEALAYKLDIDIWHKQDQVLREYVATPGGRLRSVSEETLNKILADQRILPEVKDMISAQWPETDTMLAEVRLKITEAELALQRAATGGDPKLLRLKPNWHERILREENRAAAREGVERLRIGDADTIAKVEGWPGKAVYKSPGAAKNGFTGRFKEYVGETYPYSAETTDGKWVVMRRGDWKRAGFGGVDTVLDSYMLRPGHQGLYDFYKKDVADFVQRTFGARQVSDRHGKWWEWDVNPNDAHARIPEFGRTKAAASQRGMFNVEGMEQTVAAAKATREKLAKGGAPAAGVAASAAQVDAFYKRSHEIEMAGRRHHMKELFGEVPRIADFSAGVKRELVDAGAKVAVRDFELSAGAMAKARNYFDYKIRPFYNQFKVDEIGVLDSVVRDRVTIEIGRRQKNYKFPGGVTPDKAMAHLLELEKTLGPEQFQRMNAAANEVFNMYRGTLREARQAGLITQESFDKLIGYDYSPTKYLETIDPMPKKLMFRGKPVDVPESGIQYLEGGALDPIAMSSRALLAEHVARLENRIAKNAANKRLVDFANERPDNGIVKPWDASKAKWKSDGTLDTVVPEIDGYKILNARVDGRETPFYMRSDLAEQWVTAPRVMHPYFENVLKALSLVEPFKAGITKYNPAWPLVSMPRDMMYSWMFAHEYSSLPPVALGQMGIDMLTVAKDAATRGPRYQQFIAEGGGASYLVGQNKGWFTHRWAPAELLSAEESALWRGTKATLSWPSEFSETLIRLALRERAIKNGASSVDATHIARSTPDFAQGGLISRGLDSFIPFANATLRAVHDAAQNVKAHPVEFGAKATMAYGMFTAWNTSLVMTDPEAWQSYPARDKINSIIIPLGGPVIDKQGNKRYPYFAIRLDQLTAPLQAMSVASVEKYFFDRVPEDVTMNAIRSFATNVPLSDPIPPSVSALFALRNHDVWSNEDVWKGMRGIPPEMEFKGLPSEPTPEVWKMLGGAAGASPERMRAAFNKAVPTSNFMLDLAGKGFRAATENLTPYQQSLITEEMLSKWPGVRQTYKLTHPAVNEMDRLEELARTPLGQAKLQKDKVDEMYALHKEGLLPGGAKSVQTWINSQPPEERERLANAFRTKVALDKIFTTFKASDGIPSRVWWERSASLPVEARAEVFYDRWLSASQDDRRRMVAIARTMGQYGVGYAGQEFEVEFARIRKQRGDQPTIQLPMRRSGS